MSILEKTQLYLARHDLFLKCRCCKGLVYLTYLPEDVEIQYREIEEYKYFFYNCYAKNKDFRVCIELDMAETQELIYIIKVIINLYKLNGAVCVQKYIDNINNGNKDV